MLVIGHRGAAGLAPENTPLSFRKAINLGVEWIEFDVRKTADNKIVVFHDPTLERVTNGKGRVCDYTLVELLTHFCVGDISLNAHISTLGTVLRDFGVRVKFNIELKEDGIAGQVFEIVRQYKRIDDVIISAFDDNENKPGDSSNWVDLLWMKRKEPDLKISLLAAKQENFLRALALARAYPVYSINPSFDLTCDCTFKYNVFAMQRVLDCKFFVWTVNDPKVLKNLLEAGIDGIFTDYPDRFLTQKT